MIFILKNSDHQTPPMFESTTQESLEVGEKIAFVAIPLGTAFAQQVGEPLPSSVTPRACIDIGHCAHQGL